jgi:hypothetical protein
VRAVRGAGLLLLGAACSPAIGAPAPPPSHGAPMTGTACVAMGVDLSSCRWTEVDAGNWICEGARQLAGPCGPYIDGRAP